MSIGVWSYEILTYDESYMEPAAAEVIMKWANRENPPIIIDFDVNDLPNKKICIAEATYHDSDNIDMDDETVIAIMKDLQDAGVTFDNNTDLTF